MHSSCNRVLLDLEGGYARHERVDHLLMLCICVRSGAARAEERLDTDEP